MYFCLRVDLDYVPWDTPDAAEFGHAEPAVILRLLALARSSGFKFQFFASNRVLRAFPATADLILSEGHDLDWLCKHPEDGSSRLEEAELHFSNLAHDFRGLAVKGPWPEESLPLQFPSSVRFLSAAPGPCPAGLQLYPVEMRPLRQAIRAASSVRSWTDQVKRFVRDQASRRIGVTVAVRPQVLGKHDAKLTHVREILDLAAAVELRICSLRDVEADRLKKAPTP